jgi:steroid delta-isomerase-like uncharacterized protein
VTTEESKAVVRRGFEELWEKRNLAAAEEVFTPDLVFHTITRPVPYLGPDGFREFFNEIRTGFPDFQISVEELFGEGDKVAMRFTFRATNTGAYHGVPPIGRPVTIPFIEIFTVRDGKIAHIYHMANVLDVLQQLGLLPPGGLPRPLGWLIGRLHQLRQGNSRAPAIGVAALTIAILAARKAVGARTRGRKAR